MNEKKYFIVSIMAHWKSYHVKDIMKIKKWEVVKGRLPFLCPYGSRTRPHITAPAVNDRFARRSMSIISTS